MQPIKTAVIGCGQRAYAHVAALREAGVLELVCACDKLPDRAERAAAAWGVPALLTHRQVLADPAIEAVIIATDVANHLPVAWDALAAGKHFICEKPLGDNVAEACRLVEAVEATDRVTCVSFQLRFAPQFAAIRAAMPEMDPVQIHFSRCRGMMKEQYLNPTPFCGVMDFCAHDFDMVSWCMGRQPEAVTAAVRRNTFTRDTGAADTITALIDFGDGRSATILSSIGAAEVGSKLDIVGACGNISVRGAKAAGTRFARCASAGAKTPLELPDAGGANPDAELQKAFARQIRAGVPSPAASLREGLHCLLVTMACHASSEQKRRVALGES